MTQLQTAERLHDTLVKYLNQTNADHIALTEQNIKSLAYYVWSRPGNGARVGKLKDFTPKYRSKLLMFGYDLPGTGSIAVQLHEEEK